MTARRVDWGWSPGSMIRRVVEWVALAPTTGQHDMRRHPRVSVG
jgi:hypothetical protein